MTKFSEISKAGSTSLDTNIKEFAATSRELIKAYGDMHTGGANPDQDLLVIEKLGQVQNDAFMMHTAHENKIIEKHNNDIWIIPALGGFGFGWYLGQNPSFSNYLTSFFHRIGGLLPMKKH